MQKQAGCSRKRTVHASMSANAVVPPVMGRWRCSAGVDLLARLPSRLAVFWFAGFIAFPFSQVVSGTTNDGVGSHGSHCECGRLFIVRRCSDAVSWFRRLSVHPSSFPLRRCDRWYINILVCVRVVGLYSSSITLHSMVCIVSSSTRKGCCCVQLPVRSSGTAALVRFGRWCRGPLLVGHGQSVHQRVYSFLLKSREQQNVEIRKRVLAHHAIQ